MAAFKTFGKNTKSIKIYAKILSQTNTVALLLKRFGKRTDWLFLIKTVFPWQINYPEFIVNLWLHGCY